MNKMNNVIDLHIENMIDAGIEEVETFQEFKSAAAKRDRMKKSGNVGNQKDELESKLKCAAHSHDEAVSAHYVLSRVLGFDSETEEKYNSAIRFTRRWYKLTNYQRCIPESIRLQIADYLFGKKTGEPYTHFAWSENVKYVRVV